MFYFRYDPSLLGMGYLMSTEVLLGAIAGFFFQKALSVFSAGLGFQGSFPPYGSDSSGAFIFLAFFLVWGARRYLWQSFRRSFWFSSKDLGVSLAPRWAVNGAIIGMLLVATFFIACKISLHQLGFGFSLWIMAFFMFLFFAYALVFARIRGEAGTPMVWLFPYGAHRDMLLNFLGSKTIVEAGGPASMLVLSDLYFLSRGYFQSESGVQVESFRLGEITGVGTGSMAGASVVGLLMGLACGMFVLLSAFYTYGANNLKGGDNMKELFFQESIQRIVNPVGADPNRAAWIIGTFVGMVATAGLALGRRAFFRFPFHPLGLAMGLAFGSPLWGPFLIAWLCRLAAIKIGGIKLYRRFVPLFIGIVVGHYFVGGIFWGLIGLAGNPAFPRYRVYFG
jgi:hypothetical protein